MMGSSHLLAVDVGEYGVKALDGKWSNSANFSSNVHDYSVIVKESGLSDSESTALTVRQVLKSFKLKGVDIVTSIPLGEAIMREMTVETGLTDYQVEGAIEVDLADSLPFSTDQVYFDYVPRRNAKNEFIVAAARRDLVDPLSDAIKSANKNILDPEIDIDAYAFGRLISQIHADILRADKVILLIDVGHRKTRFYFYDANGLVFSREQQVGGYHATEAISEVYDLEFAEAENRKHGQIHDESFQDVVVAPYAQSFSEQLSLVLDFYEASGKSDKRIAKIEFVGGGACLNGFISKISKQVDYPVTMLDLSPIWKGDFFKDNEWLHFCAKYAHCVALTAQGEML